MKNPLNIAVITLCLAGSIHNAQCAEAIKDSSMGLSKQSVFEVPAPERFEYQGGMPGGNPLHKRAYPAAPPQIPHSIESLTPIKAGMNFCVSCHGVSTGAGQPKSGVPTPIPISHYTDLRHAPGEPVKKLVEARYVCTQCHVPQADLKPLVNNQF